MKQRPTAEQMLSLSPNARERYYQWCKERDYGSTFEGEFTPTTQPPIGVMIEFLGEDWVDFVFIVEGKSILYNYEGELCDALFESMKKVLEHEEIIHH